MFKSFKDQISQEQFKQTDSKWRKDNNRKKDKTRLILAIGAAVLFSSFFLLAFLLHTSKSYIIKHKDSLHTQVQADNLPFTFLLHSNTQSRSTALGMDHPSLALWIRSTLHKQANVLYYAQSSNTFLPMLINFILAKGNHLPNKGSLKVITNDQSYRQMLKESLATQPYNNVEIHSQMNVEAIYDLILVEKISAVQLPKNLTYTDIVYIQCTPELLQSHTTFTITAATNRNNKIVGSQSLYSIVQYDAMKEFTLFAVKDKPYALCNARTLYSIEAIAKQPQLEKQSLLYLIEYFRTQFTQMNVVIEIKEPFLYIVLSRIVKNLFNGKNGQPLEKYCNYLPKMYFVQSIEYQSKSVINNSIGIFAYQYFVEDMYPISIVAITNEKEYKHVAQLNEKYNIRYINGRDSYRCMLTPNVAYKSDQVKCNVPFYVQLTKK